METESNDDPSDDQPLISNKPKPIGFIQAALLPGVILVNTSITWFPHCSDLLLKMP
jgi:hypothetical protein